MRALRWWGYAWLSGRQSRPPRTGKLGRPCGMGTAQSVCHTGRRGTYGSGFGFHRLAGQCAYRLGVYQCKLFRNDRTACLKPRRGRAGRFIDASWGNLSMAVSGSGNMAGEPCVSVRLCRACAYACAMAPLKSSTLHFCWVLSGFTLSC